MSSGDPVGGNASAWGLPRVVDFFERHRASSDDIYRSEWLFLEPRLREGMTILDIGCAQGGFALAIGEHLANFSYTGVDINEHMIRRARKKHPSHTFLPVAERDFSALGKARFDLVLALGILHLHETWRATLAAAWQHTARSLIFDLRETPGSSIEDKAKSYFRMDFHGGDEKHRQTILPYNVINAAEAQQTVMAICPDAGQLGHYGYLHPVSPSAVCPFDRVMMTVYCVEK